MNKSENPYSFEYGFSLSVHIKYKLCAFKIYAAFLAFFASTSAK